MALLLSVYELRQCLNDPSDKAVKAIEERLMLLHTRIDKYFEICLWAAAVYLGTPNAMVAWYELCEFVVEEDDKRTIKFCEHFGQSATDLVMCRLRIVATAFDDVLTARGPSNENPALAHQIANVAKRRFDTLPRNPSLGLEGLSWRSDPHIMARLERMPLFDFVISGSHENMPLGTTVEAYLRQLTATSIFHQHDGMVRKIERDAKYLPEKWPTRQLDVIVILLGLLYKIDPHLDLRQRLIGWVKGDEPNRTCSMLRLSTICTGLLLLPRKHSNEHDYELFMEALTVDLAEIEPLRDRPLGMSWQNNIFSLSVKGDVNLDNQSEWDTYVNG